MLRIARSVVPALLVLTCWLLPVACHSPPDVVVLNGSTMGSTWTVSLSRPSQLSLPEVRAGVVAELDRVVAQMSTWDQDSDISRYNNAAAGTQVELKLEFYEVLLQALELAQRSGGAFDPTVGPLVDLWGFGPGGGEHRAPDPQQLARVRTRVGWQKLVLDRQTRRLTQPGGLKLDLSALAPGYASDQIAAWLHRNQIHNFLVDVGGEFRAAGEKTPGKAWVVGIQQPDTDHGETWDTLLLRDQALTTSGDYRRYYIDQGERRSHHIDPRTGEPVKHSLASVSVLRPTAMEADGLGTVLSVLGPEEGWAWAEQQRIAALFLIRTADGFEARQTAGFAAAIAASNP